MKQNGGEKGEERRSRRCYSLDGMSVERAGAQVIGWGRSQRVLVAPFGCWACLEMAGLVG